MPPAQQRRSGAIEWAFGENRAVILGKPVAPGSLSDEVDLRPFMSVVDDQGPIGSCTANALSGLIDYLQIATSGKYIDVSRLFMYKASRNLLQFTGDVGAYNRSVFKALAMFGCCPEDYYPYYPAAVNVEPDAFCYAMASNFKGIAYYRLETLDEIRQSIHQGYPVMLGFTVYESILNPVVSETGVIPYPVADERAIGGHAVLAVGYRGAAADGQLIIRNSWGADWGVDGYGLLPYAYVSPQETALADDFWTLTLMSFADVPGTHAAPYTMTDW